MPDAALIELKEITKRYSRGREDVHALAGISLSVPRGEFLAVVGASGSGKSTLLNIVGAIDKPDGGRVSIAGQDITHLPDRALTRLRGESIGFVFQQFFLQPTLTARENVLLPTLFTQRKQAAARADDLLRRMGLADRSDHLPAQLSGGEMQRVAISRALINEPKLLLADEPTGNLDSSNAQSLYELLAELHADGLTIIVVTHSAELAAGAERCIHLRDGKIIDDRALRVAAAPQ